MLERLRAIAVKVMLLIALYATVRFVLDILNAMFDSREDIDDIDINELRQEIIDQQMNPEDKLRQEIIDQDMNPEDMEEFDPNSEREIR